VGLDRVLSPAPGTGEINDDPGLVAPDAGDYTLLADSPSIDAGNPDAQFNDPDGTRNDMGAFCHPQNGSPVDPATWGKMKRLFR